ncbi:ATP-binding cassette domain-containing protein [Planococcaceae bacterium Storch 2/2-2]|nr:ATP-binding cassette domain-containing protein [Planococcaceae bacterium Storch 2/2-2]
MTLFHLQDVQFLDVLHVDELTIERGKTTCIVGTSGAGKSTLVRLLNRMNPLTSGTITYEGVDLETIDPVALRRDVVMLAQTPLLFKGTVEENVQKGVQFAEKEEKTKEEIARALETVSLAIDGATDVAKLSGGEKQRVALARVLLMDPNVYLLDEPTSALDPGTEEEVMRAFLEETKRRQQTVLIITHSRDVAEQFADRIITVEKGRIVHD